MIPQKNLTKYKNIPRNHAVFKLRAYSTNLCRYFEWQGLPLITQFVSFSRSET